MRATFRTTSRSDFSLAMIPNNGLLELIHPTVNARNGPATPISKLVEVAPVCP